MSKIHINLCNFIRDNELFRKRVRILYKNLEVEFYGAKSQFSDLFDKEFNRRLIEMTGGKVVSQSKWHDSAIYSTIEVEETEFTLFLLSLE